MCGVINLRQLCVFHFGFTNSESTTVSLSVSARAWRPERKKVPIATAARTSEPASQGIHLRPPAGTVEAEAAAEIPEEAAPAGTEAEEGTAAMVEEVGCEGQGWRSRDVSSGALIHGAVKERGNLFDLGHQLGVLGRQN